MFLHKTPRYVEPPPPHQCAVPGVSPSRNNVSRTAIDCGLGSIWRCEDCQQHYQLTDCEPDEWGYGGGWYWRRISIKRASRYLRRHAPRADGTPVVEGSEEVHGLST